MTRPGSAQSRAEDAVLLTGATGFVGMELLARYLERSERPVIALVRARNDERRAGARRRRCWRTCSAAARSSYAGRVEAVAGELTAPRPGLGLRALAGDRRSASRRSSTAPRRCRSAAARAGSRDQRRGHPPDAGAGRAGAASAAASSATATSRRRTSPALMPAASASATSISARRSVTPTSSRSSKPSSWSAPRPACRSRSCAPASSSATVAAAGRRPSTSSTGRCGRSRAACSRRSRRSPRRPSTSSRSTTSPTRCTSCASAAAARRETFHLTAGADASTIQEIARAASRYFKRPMPRVLPPAEFAAFDGGALSAHRARGQPQYFPYFAVGTVFEDADDARPPRAGGNPRLAAGGVPRAAARLRDAQPLGQAPDRSRRGAGRLGHVDAWTDYRVDGPPAGHRPVPRRRPRRARARLARLPVCLRTGEVEWRLCGLTATIRRSNVAALAARSPGAST